MKEPTGRGRASERGSAMVLAILVSVIMTLLGVSYLLMAETENRISENERLYDQALFAGESAVRMVKVWFDRPAAAANLINPPLAAIDRTQRLINDDGDPSTAPLAADGSPSKPYYKQGIDLNADSTDDVFDKPYRDDLFNTLMGTEAGPDMRIDAGTSSAAATFLNNLSSGLLANYPSGQTLQARITRIDIYEPPYVNVAGTWMRYGMATVKATARIYKVLDGTETILAERVVKAVLNETPFPGPFGPLHSCDTLAWNGDFKVHWGVGTAVSNSDLHNNHQKQASSLPRVAPLGAKLDTLWAYNDDADFAAYKTAIDGLKVDDPWFRYISGGPIADAPNTNTLPEPFTWVAGNPFADGELPYHPSTTDPTDPYYDPDGDTLPDNWDGSHSNMVQNMPVGCPEFDYDTWKEIATSGGAAAVHYYTWSSGMEFKENGVGTARTYRDITDNETGLFFFDTKDGQRPVDNDSDGNYDNLTPEISMSGGTYGVRGFVYLNSENFRSTGLGGRTATYNAPGEPFQDKNLNGRWDAGEDWINLSYPAALGDNFIADATDTLQDDGTMGGAGTEMRNSRGPDVAGTAAFWGILYTNGHWDATGNAQYYGSVISYQGIGEVAPTGGTPDIYWDQSIQDSWPPDGWDLPRVIITRWETDL